MRHFLLAVVVLLFAASCTESNESSVLVSNGSRGSDTWDAEPTDSVGAPDTDTDTETASSSQAETRGNLEDFPSDSDCIAACPEACARVSECGGEQNDAFPLPAVDECTERCILALDGPMWDDATGSFRCCAAQATCSDVAVCGGWLAHPVTTDPCQTLCSCLFGATDISALWAGLTAPPGYTLAKDAVAVAMDDHTTNFELAYGARVRSLGRLAFLDLSNPATALSTKELLAQENVVPTFRDPAGRLCAASGSMVVRLPDESRLQELATLAREHDLGQPQRLAFSKDLYLLSGIDGWRAALALPAVAALPGATAELDMLRLYERRMVPNDPFFKRQWHLRNTGQEGLALPGVDSRVSEAWELTLGTPSTVIAILDDGVDIEHPDLADNVVGSTNFPEDWRDQTALGNFGWHGTSCAGVAAARANNGEGGAGVCPQCSLHGALLGGDAGLTPGSGMQVTDDEMADLFVALVDGGAAIISNSWGLGGEDPRVQSQAGGTMALPIVVREAFYYAEHEGRGGKGTVILFAAGNSNQDVEDDPYAAYTYVVAVAAVDDQGLKAYYSNFGERIHVAGPSNGGLFGITTTTTIVGGDLQQDPPYTESFGGTSSACPFVAGVTGLVISANPALTAKEVRDVLASSAQKIDPVFGDYDEAGHSPSYGYGLVDAYRAVKLALAKATSSTECDPEGSCRAPSDAPCGSSCDRSGACVFCRTSADCPGGECQSLPELGRSVCVSATTDGCEQGYETVNGRCLPSRQACDLCDEDEACDGRDNDCNGLWDDDEDCRGGRCHQQERGCVEGESCAGISCSEACVTDEDCDSGECEAVKDRYGAIHQDQKICYGGTGMCERVCQAMVSSKDDAAMQGFLDCMAPDTCDAAYECISQM